MTRPPFTSFICATLVWLAQTLALAQANPPPSLSLQAEAEALRSHAAQSYLEDLQRADRLSFRLLQAASPYCVDNRKYSFGAIPRRLADMPERLQPALSPLFEPEPDLYRFLSIPPGSPAWESQQLTAQDRILSIAEHTPRTPIKPGWALDRASTTEALNDALVLTILRQGTRQEVRVRPHMLCNQALTLHAEPRLIAHVTRQGIALSTGLMRYVASDDELALLLASQLARHALPAGVMHTATAAEARQRADYLAAYLVVHAGYNLNKSLRLWQHIGTNPDAPELSPLMPEHHVSTERLLHLRQTLAEIEQKHTSGRPITPTAAWLPTTPPPRPLADAALSADTPAVARHSAEELALNDLARIPFLRSGGIVGYQRFLASPMRPRAFALAQTGAWSYKSGASAATDALTHCELLARGAPCYLYALDDRLVWNTETAAHTPQPAIAGITLQNLRAPSASGFAKIDDLAAIPLPGNDLTPYKAFLEKPSPRAFVITAKGESRYWIGPGALEYALAWCEGLAENGWLYAVDNAVVWQAEPARRIRSRKQLASHTSETQFFDKP